MKKSLTKRISITMAITIFLLICFSGSAAGPGTENDPLVSVSYINEVVMPQFKSYVDSKLANTNDSSFQVVEVKKGQTVIGFQGTEMILRMGSATVVATQKGGISDVTSGTDLPMYSQMPANHHLIIPFTDWRGVTMQTDGILLIKGSYKFA